ncbi:uncharacterized protein LOC142616969 [Castanea sativa]|uniref:uncharacterized protein LOC142616969 n=1 Tax=Castanea sativa TaxID=21020 RepID=UPI003F64B143
MAIREGETLRTYLNRYWEAYKEIDGDFEDVALRTFKGKSKAKMFLKKRDPRGGGYQGNCPIRDFPNQMSSTGAQLVNSLFKESLYQILEKIKSGPYFKWPNKMGGDASRRNQNLYFHYHQDKGHTTKDCRTLHDHLNQLEKAGKLNQFLHQPIGQFGHLGAELHGSNVPRLALGTINVIFTKPRVDLGAWFQGHVRG